MNSDKHYIPMYENSLSFVTHLLSYWSELTTSRGYHYGARGGGGSGPGCRVYRPLADFIRSRQTIKATQLSAYKSGIVIPDPAFSKKLINKGIMRIKMN
jgi:hypothetical protein